MSDLAIINGELMPLSEARISVLDLGFLRGVGAFETFRTYGGHPHALGEHVNRLWRAAASLGIEPCFEEAELRRLCHQAFTEMGVEDLRVNLVVTPGLHTHGVFGAANPTWVALLRELVPPPAEWYEHGVSAVTFRGERIHPEIKTTSYITGRRGLIKAAEQQAHEAFYLDHNDCVTEGVTSNIMIREGERVIVPAAECLPGITIAGLEPIAKALGLSWSREAIPTSRLYAADEVWISSAIRELVPVVAIDGHQVADGKPGTHARTLRERYHAKCSADAERDAR